ncbi:hypothetical protein LI328DRAFT_161742 [Trichoderma asperelloides]|nr:hypothetical protein LI328DRAFT_161742 [Trichoderma asperelloides]
MQNDLNQRQPEFSGSNVRYIYAQSFPVIHEGAALSEHGTQAQLVVVRNNNRSPSNKNMHIHEWYLASLVAILDEVVPMSAEQRAKVVINMSFGWEQDAEAFIPSSHCAFLFKLLQVLDRLDAVMVAATHNYNSRGILYEQKVNGWPSRYANPATQEHNSAGELEKLDNLIVVSTDINSVVSPLNPGLILGDVLLQVTAPHITAVIAYWRSLQDAGSWNSELAKPANVKKLVMYMHRSLQYPSIRIPDYPDKNPIPQRVPFIWTGRVADGDCLVNPKLKRCPPYLAGSSIADLKPHGADCAGGLSSARHSRKRKRQDSASCPLILRPGGPSNGEGGQGNPLTYKPGEPSPTCASGCRKLCTEYYCSPIPTGTPPDFWDPEDPAHPPQTSDAPGSDPTPLSSTMTTTTTTKCSYSTFLNHDDNNNNNTINLEGPTGRRPYASACRGIRRHLSQERRSGAVFQGH